MFGFEINAICESCGKPIEVSPQTVEKKDVQCIENDEWLQIITYECKECNRVHIVQIDNIDTKNLLRELTKLMARAARKKRAHKQLSKKEVTKLTKIRTDLAEKRLLLKQEYQGKHYLSDSLEEKEFEVSM